MSLSHSQIAILDFLETGYQASEDFGYLALLQGLRKDLEEPESEYRERDGETLSADFNSGDLVMSTCGNFEGVRRLTSSTMTGLGRAWFFTDTSTEGQHEKVLIKMTPKMLSVYKRLYEAKQRVIRLETEFVLLRIKATKHFPDFSSLEEDGL